EDAITAFAFLMVNNPGLVGDVIGSITGTNISAITPFGTDLSSLTATLVTTGSSVDVNGVQQINGTTGNDFTDPVTYTVIADDGATSFYTVTVSTAPESPPTDLVYATNPAVYVESVPITPNAPSVGGGLVDSYSISPPLPAGLGIDSVTGTISGTPS